jgi:hypothetical protein
LGEGQIDRGRGNVFILYFHQQAVYLTTAKTGGVGSHKLPTQHKYGKSVSIHAHQDALSSNFHSNPLETYLDMHGYSFEFIGNLRQLQYTVLGGNSQHHKVTFEMP